MTAELTSLLQFTGIIVVFGTIYAPFLNWILSH
jgi:hypothetical protein